MRLKIVSLEYWIDKLFHLIQIAYDMHILMSFEGSPIVSKSYLEKVFVFLQILLNQKFIL